MKKIIIHEGKIRHMMVAWISFLFAVILVSSCNKEETVGPSSNDASAERRALQENSLNPSLKGETTLSPVMPEGAMLYVSHGACFGRCAEYSFTLSNEGEVVYEGISNVKTTGTVRYYVNPSITTKIAQGMIAEGFNSFENFYPQVIDAPMTVTGLNYLKSGAKTVVDYGSGVPDNLIVMRQSIEKTLGIDALVNGPVASVLPGPVSSDK
jgi:hypothetical protein